MDQLTGNRARAATAETRKRKTRAALSSALLELLGEKPFDQILITEITARARVGYATFFRHYQAKEEVLADIAADQIRELLGMSIPVMMRTDSAQSCRALCEYVYERQTLWRTLLTGGAAGTVRAEFVRQARDWGVEAGEWVTVRVSQVPVDLGTVCAAGSTLDALAWWMERTGEYPVSQIATIIDQLIITPFVRTGRE